MSQYVPERLDARSINLTNRFVSSSTVVASPALAAETIVASVTLPTQVQTFSSVFLIGWAALTVGTSGVSIQAKLRQTGTSGTTLADSGALTATAGDLYSPSIVGFDASPAAGQVYKLTLTIASGVAESTVSAVGLIAIVV